MRARDHLELRRNPDGGFGPVMGSTSEPEATALAGVALGDRDAAAWLEESQAADGSIGMRAGSVFRDVTALACLAMVTPAAVGSAVGWVRGSLARSEPSTDELPHDPSRGWGWTRGTFGWVEPTAWGVLALRTFDGPSGSLDDGIAMLTARECVGGGWNYGTREVLGESLPPFVQTTAVALIALHGLDLAIVDRGIEWLDRAWRREADGLLSTAVSAVALSLYGTRASRAAVAAVEEHPDTAGADTGSLAWAHLALGDGLDRLEVT